MKLSEIKGERVFDVIADMVEPLANIAEDEKALAYFQAGEPAKGQTERQAMVARVKKGLPHLLKTHRKDLVAVFAALHGVPAKEYAEKLTMATLVSDLVEMADDDELMAFLL